MSIIILCNFLIMKMKLTIIVSNLKTNCGHNKPFNFDYMSTQLLTFKSGNAVGTA